MHLPSLLLKKKEAKLSNELKRAEDTKIKKRRCFRTAASS